MSSFLSHAFAPTPAGQVDSMPAKAGELSSHATVVEVSPPAAEVDYARKCSENPLQEAADIACPCDSDKNPTQNGTLMRPHSHAEETVNLSTSTKIHSNGEYSVRETPMGTKRALKVVFMGAGCSGINFAHQLQKSTENVELVIYDKNGDVGGTWLENRYPGCACDIPSVCYQYSWLRKPDWERYYSGSRQIHDYFRQVATDTGAFKYIKFHHRIVRAEWLDLQGKWKITVMRNEDLSDTFDDYADFFIHGGGVLNNWRWPNIKGLKSFRGSLLHTARWDDSVDLQGKRVLNIGIGSSGVQVIPTIINEVDQLYVVARSPVWITAGFAPEYAGPQGENFSYSSETQQRFASDPEFYLWYCKAIESELNIRFKFYITGSKDAEQARKYSIQEMQRKLAKKPELMDKLIPKNFGVGCRRPTPGNGFLEALCEDKTQVLTEEIQEVTETGFVDAQGQQHEVDVIICATGFDTSFRTTFPLIVDGQNVQDVIEQSGGDLSNAYLGLSVAGVPNYFVFIGPYGPLAHGSVVPMVEAYTQYILQVLSKAQTEDIKSIRVKPSVAAAFTQHADAYLHRTAWSGGCSSWFKNGDSARKPLCWPGSRVHYLTMLQTPRYEDYDFGFLSQNRFNFLGNGYDVRESDGRDITWYYGLLNGVDKQPSSFPEPVF